MPDHTYSNAVSFVFSSPCHSIPALTMDPVAPPPVPNPTTPPRIFPQTKFNVTPNRFAATFAITSQPPDSTQRALQESLIDNMVFANEAIVQTIFQPSKVNDQDVREILTQMNKHKYLKAARAAVINGKGPEKTKYKAMVRHVIVVNGGANLGTLAHAA